MPIICFNCNEVGYIVARCLDKKNWDERHGDKYKRRKDEDSKRYEDRGKKSCYIAKEDSKIESSDSEEVEVVYVVMKDDSNEDEATTLISYVKKSDKWIIDSGCSHHITRDRSKFKTFELYDGNIVKFGNDAPCPMEGKWYVIPKDNNTCGKTYYVEGLNYNFLSVSQLNRFGCNVELNQKKALIYDAKGELIGSED